VGRKTVTEELKEYKKHDLRSCGELDEHETMMFLEHRGTTKTATELRELIADIDKDHNHTVNFLEWCCFWFQKNYDDLNDFADEEARERAMAEARAAGLAAELAEAAIEEAKRAEEAAAEARAAELERESKLTGVAGAAAFFKRQAEATQDTTMTNAERITAEAARRRALREAKKAQADAILAAATQKSAADVQKEVILNAQKSAEAEAAAEAARIAAEKAERAAKKKAINDAFAAKMAGKGP